jgi:hypothetical protein
LHSFAFNEVTVKTGATATDGRNGRQSPFGVIEAALSAARALSFIVRRLSLQSLSSARRGRLNHLAVVLTLILSLANPPALLQSVAWAGMLVKFSRQASVIQAVGMTFDGQHPCKLCNEIAAGKAREHQPASQSVTTGKDLKLGCPPPSISLFHPPTPGVLPDAPVLPRARSETPPTPPPRLA